MNPSINIKHGNTQRIQSIDLLRGIVMIIMALDHCRDLLHYGSSIDQDPLDFNTTTPFLFFSRWITHFCAPTFVFLSGTGIFLYGSKSRTKKQVAKFLFTRGLWLLFIEIFLIDPSWNFIFSEFYLQVIWAIGISMIILSALQFLPYTVLLITGIIIVCGHNLLDKIVIDEPFWPSVIWSMIHQDHTYQLNDHFLLIIHYPFLPWLGLMILGYCIGKLYLPQTQQAYRRKFLFGSGAAAIVLFIIFRTWNLYGEMHNWTQQKTGIFTLLDFVKTTKYPPSLLFMLMTIGPALITLSFAENITGTGWFSSKILVFGKVPFFYYILHVPLIHIIAWILFFAGGHHWSDLDFSHHRDGSMPYGSGHSLFVVYLVWISVIIILYFPCRWYAKYKATHKNWWLSYV
ncbi:MAG: DUF1624 domain-containing protein [Bacteroidetes bacterium]|nr:DUF1624 domain-containing protein [Bacteroidota bacterium]